MQTNFNIRTGRPVTPLETGEGENGPSAAAEAPTKPSSAGTAQSRGLSPARLFRAGEPDSAEQERNIAIPSYRHATELVPPEIILDRVKENRVHSDLLDKKVEELKNNPELKDPENIMTYVRLGYVSIAQKDIKSRRSIVNKIISGTSSFPKNNEELMASLKETLSMIVNDKKDIYKNVEENDFKKVLKHKTMFRENAIKMDHLVVALKEEYDSYIGALNADSRFNDGEKEIIQGNVARIYRCVQHYYELNMKGYAACAAHQAGMDVKNITNNFSIDFKQDLYEKGEIKELLNIYEKIGEKLIELKTVRRDASDPDQKQVTVETLNKLANKTLDFAIARKNYELYAACSIYVDDSSVQIVDELTELARAGTFETGKQGFPGTGDDRVRVAEAEAGTVSGAASGSAAIPGQAAAAPAEGDVKPSKKAKQRRNRAARNADAEAAEPGQPSAVDEAREAAPPPPASPTASVESGDEAVYMPYIEENKGQPKVKSRMTPELRADIDRVLASKVDPAAEAAEGWIRQEGRTRTGVAKDIAATLATTAPGEAGLSRQGRQRNADRRQEAVWAREAGSSVKKMNPIVLEHHAPGSEKLKFELDFETLGARVEVTNSSGYGVDRKSGKRISKLPQFRRSQIEGNNQHGKLWVLASSSYVHKKDLKYIRENGGVHVGELTKLRGVLSLIDGAMRQRQTA